GVAASRALSAGQLLSAKIPGKYAARRARGSAGVATAGTRPREQRDPHGVYALPPAALHSGGNAQAKETTSRGSKLVAQATNSQRPMPKECTKEASGQSALP